MSPSNVGYDWCVLATGSSGPASRQRGKKGGVSDRILQCLADFRDDEAEILYLSYFRVDCRHEVHKQSRVAIRLYLEGSYRSTCADERRGGKDVNYAGGISKDGTAGKAGDLNYYLEYMRAKGVRIVHVEYDALDGARSGIDNPLHIEHREARSTNEVLTAADGRYPSYEYGKRGRTDCEADHDGGRKHDCKSLIDFHRHCLLAMNI